MVAGLFPLVYLLFSMCYNLANMLQPKELPKQVALNPYVQHHKCISHFQIHFAFVLSKVFLNFS